MPAGYFKDHEGKVQRFESAHEAAQFGYKDAISDEERSGIARPGFTSLVNPATGKLQDRFNLGAGESMLPFAQEQLSGINLNTQGLDEIRKRALDPGQSKFTQLSLEKQKQEEAAALDAATREGAGARAQAFSDLSMRGGLSGGERERIGYQSNRDTAEARQGVGRQGTMDRFNLGIEDERTKTGLLQNLPGMEVQALDPAFRKAEYMGQAKQSDIGRKFDADKFNIGMLAGDVQNKNAFDMANYQEKMKSWAADQEAEATKKSGGGTHLCTAVHREYTLTESDLDKLDRFRADAMEYFPEVFKFYLIQCEDIVPRMKAAGADVGMLRPFVNLVFKYMDKYGTEYALDFYSDYVLELLHLYMPELYEEGKQLVHKSGSN